VDAHFSGDGKGDDAVNEIERSGVTEREKRRDLQSNEREQHAVTTEEEKC
jgi:hypothetical protein